jgi:4'-phosphopantetheinyl transferase
MPALALTDVHVWAIGLDITDWRERLAPAWLSDDELLRAGRFPYEQQRRRFVVCRSALRAILSGYLETRARELSFRQGRHGKPCLDPARHADPVRFNTSHSHELAVVAVSRERELGIDIEHVRPMEGIDDIVAHHFARAEQHAFNLVAPMCRLSTFYRYWTLKEACVKAAGFGMSHGLGAIDVSAACDRSIRLPDPFTAGQGTWWSAQPLDPGPGYVGALVIEDGERPTVTRLTMAGIAPTVVATTASDG